MAPTRIRIPSLATPGAAMAAVPCGRRGCAPVALSRTDPGPGPRCHPAPEAVRGGPATLRVLTPTG